jgi:hypothetical protein
MDLPPPLPPKVKNNDRIIIVACVLLAIVVVFGIGAGSMMYFRRVRAQREALADMKKSVADEQAKMADAIKSGKTGESGAAIARLEAQLGKSAAQLGPADAKAARAMAGWLEKLQGFVHAYETSAGRLKEAKILMFNIQDRAQFETDRQIVREFLANNGKFMNVIQNSDKMVRAELDAAGVPPATLEATLAGYTKSQDQIRPLQMVIRRCDQTLGETALALIDLLDKNWGHWDRDAANGKLRFQDHETLSTFNDLMRKIQAASVEQGKAQDDLIAKSKALMLQSQGAAPGAH